MKKLVKKILGDELTLRISGWKQQYFPDAVQRKFLEEEKQVNELRRAFYGTFLKQGDLCFDVGANMGNRIVPMLELGARVVAVEPQQICYRHLARKFGNKITVITKGLDETEGSREFYISDASTISSFSPEWIKAVKEKRFKEYTWNKTVKVEMTTLDNLISEFGVPAFIKIDVEGYELNVLKGLSKPVAMISFEYTVPEQTERIKECIEQIEKHNPGIECNYSIGESQSLAIPEWISPAAMKLHIQTAEFIATGFGDVYVRTKNT